MRKVAIVSLALATVLANRADGQRVAPTALAVRGPLLSAPAAPQQGRATRGSTTLFGGIATGDNHLDLGFMAGVSFGWDLAGLPIDLRFDPSLARYGGDAGPSVDYTLLLLNFPVAVEYVFPTSGTGSSRFYVMGGLGMHYSNFNFDTNIPGFDGGDSGLDLGITLGGGVRFNSKLGIEARIVDINSFTTLYGCCL